MEDQRKLTLDVPCEDCGEEYACPFLNGVRVGKYCPTCLGIRRRAFEVERLERHDATLRCHRQEWIRGPRGIPPKYQGQTWEDFRFDNGGEGNRPKVGLLKEYAQAFPMDGPPVGVKSLLLTRDVNGVGKTMLACLVLADIINRFDSLSHERCPYQFWTSGAIKMRLRAGERFGNSESVEDVYRDFATMRLLVIDDVGKEKLDGGDASFTYEMYFTILNERYNNQLPVILTSNLKYEPWAPGGASLQDLMGRAGVSRLTEMTGGEYFVIEGEDRR